MMDKSGLGEGASFSGGPKPILAKEIFTNPKIPKIK